MKKFYTIALAGVLMAAVAACSSDEAEITTTTIDASQLTTTTTTTSTTQPAENGSTETTEAPVDAVETWEPISRISDEDGETLYILVPPGNYSDVSMENFLGDLLDDETAVSGVEIFDDRAALDAALKPEDERTADELQAIEDHHLVSLRNGREVEFQGPLDDFDDFVIGS